ncbi:hypothetical protein DFH94DRAFT_2572 [Russula ochroleuca]|uniref:DUF6534 domain-containing protein n=1 Tax=Russula ochroleuca TaxID=152965 RepID=A0A9P5TE66_9AGAM|nr:hypothetical protein DFH94DRAFT_2572 [Russula ochroleuca]
MSSDSSVLVIRFSDVEDFAAPAPKLLGAVWNWFLYGALVVQFYVYSYNFSRDSKHIKLLVHSIFFLETVQTILSGADLYYWFAAGFGNKGHLFMPFASSFDVPLMGSVVSISVQLFFVYRISVLSGKRSRWLCVIICVLSAIGGLGAFASGIYPYVVGGFVDSLSIVVFEMAWVAANTFSDLLITFAMLYHLRRILTNDGGFSRHILVSIVRLTIETNLVTTSVSIVSLLMIAVFPGTNWYMCPTYVLGKLYSNTLLVSLNNRISIRNAYGSRVNGKVFDCQVVSVACSTRSEATKDITTQVAEGPEIEQPVAETEVEEGKGPGTAHIV